MKTFILLFLPLLSFSQSTTTDSLELVNEHLMHRVQELELLSRDKEATIDALEQHIEVLMSQPDQLRMARYEIETMKKIMRGYIVQIDSLQSLFYQHRTSTNNELELLRGELIRNMEFQEPRPSPERERLTDFNLDSVEIPQGTTISLKLWINDKGKVVLVQVIHDRTSTKDQELIDHVVTKVKQQVSYSALTNSPLQAMFLKIEVI